MGLLLLLMLGVKLALDRAPRYQAEIKEWVHARKPAITSALPRVSPSFRWYGPELHFDRLELRSKDDRASAGARRRRPGRRGHLAADQQRQAACRPTSNSIRRTSSIARLGPTSFALASEIKLGGDDSSLETLTLDDLPAGKLAIRHAMVTMQNWNSALPQLTLQDVNLDVRRGDEDLSLVLGSSCRQRSAEP